eukprot:7902846-Pyramimonas_sp.AAC.2
MDSADTDIGELLFKVCVLTALLLGGMNLEGIASSSQSSPWGSDMGEMQRAKLSNELCRELGNACTKAPPKVKKVNAPTDP